MGNCSLSAALMVYMCIFVFELQELASPPRSEEVEEFSLPGWVCSSETSTCEILSLILVLDKAILVKIEIFQ